MDLLLTLLVGAVIGWLAGLIMKTGRQMGVIGNIVIGIVGSWLGSWLFGALGFAAYGAVARWVVAVAGAALLIWILKALKVYR